MQESKKKLIRVVTIVVCLGTAAIITYFNVRIKPPQVQGDVWLLCRNCRASWQMSKDDYFKYSKEHQDPNSMLAPGVVCSGCGKDSAYRAEKCGKCGLIFERSSVAHDFADRCPKCGHSSLEAKRKVARESSIK